MTLPLAGIRVLEWATWHSGPGAASMLGDLGADVIKLEHPVRGDDARGMTTTHGATTVLPGGRVAVYEHANHSKRSVTLDVKHAEGREILRKLVERSDVLLTNFRQSVIDRAGMDYEAVRQYNPKLVYAHITSYGNHGVDSDKRSFDIACQARSGMMFAMGDRDSPEPTQMQGAPLDQTGATMLAYGVLAALVSRGATGKGMKVETSLLSSAIHLQGFNLHLQLWKGRSMDRHSRSRSRNPMANTYRCADGKWLMLAEYQSDRFWPDLCNILERDELRNNPSFATRQDRGKNYRELIQVLDGIFASLPREEWLKVFKEKRCPFAYDVVNTLADLEQDPMVVENEMLVEMDHPTMGKIKTVGFPIRFDDRALPIRPAPELGQHTEEVLGEVCGYSWEELSLLRERGVI